MLRSSRLRPRRLKNLNDQEIRVAIGILAREPKTPLEIFNLTKHTTHYEERVMGIIEPAPRIKKQICELMTFDELPDLEDMKDRAKKLAEIARLSGCHKALIGGPGFMISLLEKYLIYEGIEPVFSWCEVGYEKGKRRMKFGGFVESILVEDGWLDGDR